MSKRDSDDDGPEDNEDDEMDYDDDVEFHELTREEWDKMTPKQKQQYEFYRRSMFNRKVVRCVMKKVTEKRLDEKMVLIASACAKMFVGDVVEKAREIATRNSVSPDENIAPKFIQEAYFDMVENADVLFNIPDIRL